MFELLFKPGWDRHYLKLDKPEKERIWKRIQQLNFLPSARHLKHGLPFFVAEAGQYRVCFEENQKLRIVIFVGTHKQYEKWYKSQ